MTIMISKLHFKYYASICLLLFFIPCFAQFDINKDSIIRTFDYHRDYFNILDSTKEPNTKYNYKKLLKRFQSNDSSLTNMEILSLMIGYSDNPRFKPMDDMTTEEEIFEENKHAEFQTTLDKGLVFLQSHPLSLLVLREVSFAYGQLSKKLAKEMNFEKSISYEDSSKYYMALNDKIMEAMIFSGKGRKPNEPVFALGLNDGEHFIFNVGHKVDKKTTDWNKNGNFMEIIKALKNDETYETFFFVIQHAKALMDGVDWRPKPPVVKKPKESNKVKLNRLNGLSDSARALLKGEDSVFWAKEMIKRSKESPKEKYKRLNSLTDSARALLSPADSVFWANAKINNPNESDKDRLKRLKAMTDSARLLVSKEDSAFWANANNKHPKESDKDRLKRLGNMTDSARSFVSKEDSAFWAKEKTNTKQKDNNKKKKDPQTSVIATSDSAKISTDSSVVAIKEKENKNAKKRKTEKSDKKTAAITPPVAAEAPVSITASADQITSKKEVDDNAKKSKKSKEKKKDKNSAEASKTNPIKNTDARIDSSNTINSSASPTNSAVTDSPSSILTPPMVDSSLHKEVLNNESVISADSIINKQPSGATVTDSIPSSTIVPISDTTNANITPTIVTPTIATDSVATQNTTPIIVSDSVNINSNQPSVQPSVAPVTDSIPTSTIVPISDTTNANITPAVVTPTIATDSAATQNSIPTIVSDTVNINSNQPSVQPSVGTVTDSIQSKNIVPISDTTNANITPAVVTTTIATDSVATQNTTPIIVSDSVTINSNQPSVQPSVAPVTDSIPTSTIIPISDTTNANITPTVVTPTIATDSVATQNTTPIIVSDSVTINSNQPSVQPSVAPVTDTQSIQKTIPVADTTATIQAAVVVPASVNVDSIATENTKTSIPTTTDTTVIKPEQAVNIPITDSVKSNPSATAIGDTSLAINSPIVPVKADADSTSNQVYPNAQQANISTELKQINVMDSIPIERKDSLNSNHANPSEPIQKNEEGTNNNIPPMGNKPSNQTENLSEAGKLEN